MLVLSLDMIREYGVAYDDEVKGFKEKYFEDRSQVIYQLNPDEHISFYFKYCRLIYELIMQNFCL